MLNRFFISFLGAIAGFWASIGLLFLIGTMFVVVAASNATPNVTVEKKSILYLNLSGEIIERQVAPSLIDELSGNATEGRALNDIVAAIRCAAIDSRIEGIFIEGNGSAAGTASRLDIAQALEYFKANCDKWIIAYSDSYTQGDYFLASYADEIYLNPMGAVDIHGVSSTSFFFKNLLDKVGVNVQVFKVGTYKSAVEPYISNQISDANREQQSVYLGAIWNVISSAIADNISMDKDYVDDLADSIVAAESAEKCVDLNLVSEVAYRHEVIKKLKEKTGIDEKNRLKLVDPTDYCSVADLPHTSSTNNNIAVLYAVGSIYDSGREGIVGPAIIAEIESIINDEDNDGLILRVNSPGGSAFASEQIWEALERYKKTGRLFYVSMSDYAASGGYYISCGADKIFAQPATLTGSIGIFGMVPCFENLLSNKLGVNQAVVQTNPNANFISITKEMNTAQKNAMQKTINRGYETFTRRCAEGRHIPLDSLKSIAEGRVWDGETAKRIGLVDEIGNLDEAINTMAEELGFGKKFTVTEYPELKLSFWDRVEDLQNGVVSEKALKKELGEYYGVYRKIETLKRMNPIQALMPEIVIED